MTELADVTAAAEAYGSGRYDQGKADQRAADQPAVDALTAQVAGLETACAAVQSAFDSYKASHPDPKPAVRFPGDPGVGKTYVGLSTGGGDPTAREKFWGALAGAYRSYFQWNQNDLIVARAQRDLAAGRLPVISFKDSGFWPNVAAGKDDAILVDLATKLEALKAPVFLCLHHEPTDDTATEGTAADFGNAQKRLNTLMPANVVVMPILQSAPFDPTVGGNPATLGQWLPEGSYDLVGLDTYNHRYYKPAPGNKYRDATTVLSVLDVFRTALGKPDLPIVIAEFGVRTDPASPGKAAQWLRDFVAGAAAKNVPAVCYFDSGLNVNDHGTPWSLDDKTDGTDGLERLTAYGPLVAAGAHLGRS